MAGILQIGKRQWVAGMTWASYEDAPNKDELSEDAERLSSTWAAVRLGEDCIQGGFCAAIDGQKGSKLYSLAAMLADSRKQPWLGIFKINEDLWWYVAVRDGHAILPDGDVLGGREQIYAARDRHSGYTDWNYVEGDTKLLEDLINEIADKPTRVKSLKGNPATPKVLASVALVLGAVGVGAYFWSEHLQEVKQQEAMARMRAQLANSVPNVAPEPPSPATTQPFANDFVRTCGDAVLDLPISQFGWGIDGVTCAPTGASIVWKRMEGATVDYRPNGDLAADGEVVTETIPLSLTQQSSDDRVLLAEALERMRAWSQAAGFALSMTIAVPSSNPANLPGAAPEAAPPPPPQASVTIPVSVSPFDLDFSDIPGLRITGIKMMASGWELTGTLYGR